jgi:hypothetical protein
MDGRFSRLRLVHGLLHSFAHSGQYRFGVAQGGGRSVSALVQHGMRHLSEPAGDLRAVPMCLAHQPGLARGMAA